MGEERQLARIAGVAAIYALVSALGCGFDGVTGGEARAGDAATVTDLDAFVGDAPGSSADANDVQLDGGDLDSSIEAGACGDVVSAPLNCGRCGHSCLGGTCAAGKCQPVSLVTGEVGLGAVAVDATTAYYVSENAGVVRKVPLAGGAAVDVHSTGHAPHDLALDGDRLFWTDQFGVGLFVFGTGNATTVGVGVARAVSPTSQGPYFVTATTVELWDRDLATSITAFTNNGSSPAIVTDASNAYWSAGQQIRRVAYASSSVANVVTGLGASPTSMAISATHVYWTTATSVQRAPIGTATGWVVSTIVTTETAAASLAVDATNAYWLDLTTGALRRAPITGGAAETLATFTKQLTDAPYPHQIALTSDAVYVASTSDGSLSRIAK